MGDSRNARKKRSEDLKGLLGIKVPLKYENDFNKEAENGVVYYISNSLKHQDIGIKSEFVVEDKSIKIPGFYLVVGNFNGDDKIHLPIAQGNRHVNKEKGINSLVIVG